MSRESAFGYFFFPPKKLNLSTEVLIGCEKAALLVSLLAARDGVWKGGENRASNRALGH